MIERNPNQPAEPQPTEPEETQPQPQPGSEGEQAIG
jgi:hypothetical protein